MIITEEENFFKEFEIPQKYTECCVDEHDKITELSKRLGKKVYPEITAEIREKLTNILLNIRKTYSGRSLSYSRCSKYYWDCNLYVANMIFKDNKLIKHKKLPALEGNGKTRSDALLTLCRQAKDYIKEDVKKLFGVK